MPEFKVDCIAFRPDRRGTLQGYAAFSIYPPGLAMDSCEVHAIGDKRWVTLPALNRIGEDGKVLHQPFLWIPESETYWEFQFLACSAVDTFIQNEGISLEQAPIGAQLDS